MFVFSGDEILRAITPKETLAAVEEAMLLYETGNYLMPSRSHVYHGENTLLLMPCFNNEGFSTKLVTVFPGNNAKGIPVTTGVVILNDQETGKPLALMNGQVLTALRTGAVGGVAIKHLAKPKAKTLGIIGAGGQGFYQGVFGAEAREIERIVVFNRTFAKGQAFVEKLGTQLPDIKVILVDSAEKLLEESDIIVTATTSNRPVLPEDPNLLQGKDFIGIGSFRPEMREFPQSIYSLVDKVFVDTNYAKKETGDLAIPLQKNWLGEKQVITLGRWLTDGKKDSPGETTFFKSVGMALFDLLVAQLIYKKGLELGLGQKITL